ncbi:SGNH/GDSL hydrolase family protein [Streptomyces sp. 1331.2]|uniref:SGNH/GDSL hydrolase family protein n=1 Tax=Streptomyces sp. 1331.2 TaxID=1938835 RepID=UPI000BCEC302|nr:SGNH/GDSL hydrolase family protein [Streptomyces sp. 1331.2]SOB78879.1 GDSL-like Lipase/Acylhydrolase family protein [Streptomyces sp. 1331.2]
MTTITTPVTEDLLHGHLDVEHTRRGLLPHRLPARARRRIPDDQLAMAESQPSGVRLAFRTRATAITLHTVPTKRAYPGVPNVPDGVYDLLVDGVLTAQDTVAGGNLRTVDLATGRFELAEGPAGNAEFTGLPDRDKTVEIWLPHTETTELIALDTDAPLDALPLHAAPPGAAGPRKRWVHHGSSISHGSNAAHPTGTWPALVALGAGLDLVNLGFGGSALLDPFTARTIRDTPADLISLKLGINLVNADVMRLRAFTPAVHGFLDTIRDGHPTTPLLVVSPLLCPIQEDTPGPLAPDFSDGTLRFRATGDPADRAAGRLTLTLIREELARIVADRRVDGDHALHHLDGLALYGEPDHHTHPLPDGVHPSPEAHRLIADRFTRLALAPDGPLPS